mmetsp:Transcript_34001/g.74405  ORF Transcript_34001/g.74405 Transcript_34001/m.74405 type:complete len:361 (-) Transcript_34001:772-1854(-)
MKLSVAWLATVINKADLAAVLLLLQANVIAALEPVDERHQHSDRHPRDDAGPGEEEDGGPAQQARQREVQRHAQRVQRHLVWARHLRVRHPELDERDELEDVGEVVEEHVRLREGREGEHRQRQGGHSRDHDRHPRGAVLGMQLAEDGGEGAGVRHALQHAGGRAQQRAHQPQRRHHPREPEPVPEPGPRHLLPDVHKHAVLPLVHVGDVVDAHQRWQGVGGHDEHDRDGEGAGVRLARVGHLRRARPRVVEPAGVPQHHRGERAPPVVVLLGVDDRPREPVEVVQRGPQPHEGHHDEGRQYQHAEQHAGVPHEVRPLDVQDDAQHDDGHAEPHVPRVAEVLLHVREQRLFQVVHEHHRI